MKLAITLFFSVFLFFTSQSQSYEFGFSLGATGYLGDLDTPNDLDIIKRIRPAGGVFIKYKMNDRFAFRGNLLIGKLIGDDSQSTVDWQVRRNLSFTSNIVELAGLFEVNLLKFGEDYKKWTPFVFGGVAYLHHNPKAEFEGQKVALQPLGTEGQSMPGFQDKYSLNLISIPLGAGLKFQLTDKIGMQMEITQRITFTDYLDDVSGTYVNYNELLFGNGALAAELGHRDPDQEARLNINTGDKRGGADVNDFYYSGTLSFFITIDDLPGGGGSQGCYSF